MKNIGYDGKNEPIRTNIIHLYGLATDNIYVLHSGAFVEIADIAPRSICRFSESPADAQFERGHGIDLVDGVGKVTLIIYFQIHVHAGENIIHGKVEREFSVEEGLVKEEIHSPQSVCPVESDILASGVISRKPGLEIQRQEEGSGCIAKEHSAFVGISALESRLKFRIGLEVAVSV